MQVRLDATKVVQRYNAAFKHLRQMPGFSPRAVLRAEAGSVIKRWAGLVKESSPAEAEVRARFRANKMAFGNLGGASKNEYRISVNTGARGSVPGWVWYLHPSGNTMLAGYIDDGGHIHPNHTRRFSNAAWGGIVAGMEAWADGLTKTFPYARKSVGMSRLAVIQIAHDLNIDLDEVQGGGISSSAIKRAEGAIASTGKKYKNGYGTQGGISWIKAWVKLESRMPDGVKMGMDRHLLTAIAGRRKFIERSYRKGAFDSIESAARAFPNVFTQIRLSRQ